LKNSLDTTMRTTIEQLPGSKIRDVANAGLGRPDVLAFWFGESDEVTPLEVRQAASESLLRGETFYSHNLGLPELPTPPACTATRGLTASPSPRRA
jgi:aspartate/methionine/tyrosine aminotransferase